MHRTKISINKFIIPRNRNITNEQILFKDKLHMNKSNSLSVYNSDRTKVFFLKDKDIQENSIIEEDDYNIDIYNKSISNDDNFLKDQNSSSTYKTIPIFNYFMGVNKKYVNINNHKKRYTNNYYKDYYTDSIDYNNKNNLNITFEEKIIEKYVEENLNFLNENINIFKKMHKQRVKNSSMIYKLSIDNLSQINIFKNNKNNSIFDINNNSTYSNYDMINKFSKKNKKKNIKINKKIPTHGRYVSQPFNGPYLRKNKISQVIAKKNINKNNIGNKHKNAININNDEINYQYSNKMNKIKEVAKNLFNKNSFVNIHKIKNLNITNENDKNNKNNKDGVTKANTLYNSKNNYLIEKNKNDNNQKENNYIFNLKFFNIYNNNDSNNKKKIKSKSMITDGEKEIILDDNYISNINKLKKNNKKEKDIKTPNTIIKKRVVLEEEYIIDSNGKEKFLCAKRVPDSFNKNINIKNKDFFNNKNTINYTHNSLLVLPKEKIIIKKYDYNVKNKGKKITLGSLYINNNEKKSEDKKCFSQQVSYENIFSSNNNIKSQPKIPLIKDFKKLYLIPKNNKPIINKTNTNTNSNSNRNITPKNKILVNSRSCIFNPNQIIQSNKNHNYKFLNSINKILKQKSNVHNNVNKIGNEEKIKISKYNRVNKEKKIVSKKYLKLGYKDEETIYNNSRNQNNHCFINAAETSKDKKILNYSLNDYKSNRNFKNKITNLDSNRLLEGHQKFSYKSERSNYKYIEVKSTSKDKLIENKLNTIANKSHNNHFYFESKNKKPQICTCTSMDNIKLVRKNNYKNIKTDSYNINKKGNISNKSTFIQYCKDLNNQQNPLFYSQELNKYKNNM